MAAHVHTCLRSTHRFVRNAALRGLLALLESYAASNTAIGRLSDELALVRQLAVGYTTHWTGAAAAAAPTTPLLSLSLPADHSAAAESDEHARLVWSVTWYVVETTSKFCADCTVLSGALQAAAAVLRRMGNVDLYVAILSVSANGGGRGLIRPRTAFHWDRFSMFGRVCNGWSCCRAAVRMALSAMSSAIASSAWPWNC